MFFILPFFNGHIILSFIIFSCFPIQLENFYPIHIESPILSI